MTKKITSHKDAANRLGFKGEKFAYKQLKKYGLEILERNFSAYNIGEIDIIARDGLTLCFVEVKTRQVNQTLPRDAVNWHKRLNLWKTAMVYLRKINSPQITYRFDMVEVFANKNSLIDFDYLTHIFNKDDIKKII